MKIVSVLLRWYKSFNVNYLDYVDRQAGVVTRPWNELNPAGPDEHQRFRFIEIPIEHDITTVVGANESGKSHLLSAIKKVLTGTGISTEGDPEPVYCRTDLCHYSALRDKNALVWPNIGLSFRGSASEVLSALKHAGIPTADLKDTEEFTLVLDADGAKEIAHAYFGKNRQHTQIDKSALDKLRSSLPRVEFIDSGLAFSDQILLVGLLGAYGKKPSGPAVVDYELAQEAAKILSDLKWSGDQPQIPEKLAKAIKAIQKSLASADGNADRLPLESELFRDVLGITPDTLAYLHSLTKVDRSHVEGLIAIWNKEIDRTLNLARYWEQDESFSLRVNYKQGTFFFEITDKTGSIYTFKERSSGLRYFLSYYVQAKALEAASRTRDTIILMDEPDSFLSILGQKNLLEVFESLVSPDLSRGRAQLVYTTHSPFLINRNFPRRVRLVRKGDAEEGTQFVDMARVRRYEPVRSALGIDCAQTLFMGSTNVVLEGPTDQHLMTEMIRTFVTPEDASEYIDLNRVVTVSAESAQAVEKLLAASRWGDEPVPAVVVVLDSDEEGMEVRKRLIGEARGVKQLVDKRFVLLIGDVVTNELHDGQPIVTVEDLLPAQVYAQGVQLYVAQWYPEIWESARQKIEDICQNPEAWNQGVVKGALKIFSDIVFDGTKGFDKLGVVQDAVSVLAKAHAQATNEPWLNEAKRRIRQLCQTLRRQIALAEQLRHRDSGRQAVQRIIRDFALRHRGSVSVFDLQMLCERLQAEAESLGVDGEALNHAMTQAMNEIKKLRSVGQTRIVNELWTAWNDFLEGVRKDPLSAHEIPRSEADDRRKKAKQGSEPDEVSAGADADPAG